MGIATNAIITFGVICEEGTEFPWDDHEGDFIEWWEENHKDEDIPFDVENYCSDSNEMFALTIPGHTTVAKRGYPEEIKPWFLIFNQEKYEDFMYFITKYEIEFEKGPSWFLISYWGQ